MLSSSKTQATLRTKCTSGSLAVHCAAVLMTSSQQQTCAETQIGKWIDGSGCMDGWRPIRSECAPGRTGRGITSWAPRAGTTKAIDHSRMFLHKVHLPFRGPWPRATPRATKPGRGSTNTVKCYSDDSFHQSARHSAQIAWHTHTCTVLYVEREQAPRKEPSWAPTSQRGHRCVRSVARASLERAHYNALALHL